MVVGGEHRPPLAALLHLPQVVDPRPLGLRGRAVRGINFRHRRPSSLEARRRVPGSSGADAHSVTPANPRGTGLGRGSQRRALRRLRRVQRWRGLEAVPTGWGRSIVTVGVFDGVHRGHQKLINRTVERGRARGLPTVLVTFDPHPAEIIRPGRHPARLTSLRRRAELVAELGIDAFCVLPFTPELQHMEAAAFAYEVLVDRLHAAEVVVGRNFTFGHKAAGNVRAAHRAGRPLRVRRRGPGPDDRRRRDGLLHLHPRLHRRGRRGRRRGGARPPAPHRGGRRARRPPRPRAGLPHGEHRLRGVDGAARRRRLRRALRPGRATAAVGDLGGHQPDVLRPGAHRRGVRARRRRGLLRLRRRAWTSSTGCAGRSASTTSTRCWPRSGPTWTAPARCSIHDLFPNALGGRRPAANIGAWRRRLRANRARQRELYGAPAG